MSWATEFYAGRTAIVIGGTSGIGLAIATAFRDAGAIVHATGATAAEIAAAPKSGILFQLLDVRDAAAVAAYAGSFPSVAALVDTAGVNLRAAEWTLDGFEAAIDINLTGLMRVALAFRPKLSGGAVLGIGSMFSFFGAPHAPAYAASKSGLVGLVRSLAVAFASEDIRVNALAPGWIETAMTAAPRADPARNAELLARMPLGRWGTPADVAPAALFLCSPLARYITGAVLPVDGGYLVA
ncbi:MAG TPA: SDR family oxidoreductase [Devosia sp.]|jgi:NAD(P)-dependent dehydrogenase (short-subunit alcohol dehydrogenase family)|nr:SDR family oxidoreductase [Devosia sp.]